MLLSCSEQKVMFFVPSLFLLNYVVDRNRVRAEMNAGNELIVQQLRKVL